MFSPHWNSSPIEKESFLFILLTPPLPSCPAVRYKGWNQGLANSRQALYHCPMAPALVFLWFFLGGRGLFALERNLCSILQGQMQAWQEQNCLLPLSSFYSDSSVKLPELPVSLLHSVELRLLSSWDFQSCPVRPHWAPLSFIAWTTVVQCLEELLQLSELQVCGGRVGGNV